MRHTSIKKLATVSFLVLSACRAQSAYTPAHIDDPTTRGAAEATAWHFHTGEGYSVMEVPNGEGGKMFRARSRCTLDADTPKTNPDCREKVYFFSKAEIMQFVNLAREVYSERFNTRAATMAAAGTVMVVSAKAAAAGFLAPEPTMITKVAGVGSAITSGVAGIVVSWQGYKMYQIEQTIRSIDTTMTEEDRYVSRCQQLHKDFLGKLQALGVSIVFMDNGGDYISPAEYIASRNEEQSLIRRTLDHAVTNRITARQAYDGFFREQCGQLPTVNPSPIDAIFAADWAHVPENLKQQTLAVSTKLGLTSREPIEYGQFGSGDLSRDDEQEGILEFLAQLDGDLDRIAASGSAAEKTALQTLRTRYHKISIQPHWKGNDMFRRNYRTYSEQIVDGKRYLFVNAMWTWRNYRYEATMRPFMKEVLGISSATLGD